VVISEFKAANDGTDDWIELWNRGTTTVDLQGWGIGDENHFWEINVANPPLNLAPGQFLIVYARDPASQTPSALATGFQLGPEHDLVRLWKPIPNPPNEPTYIIVSERIGKCPQESGRT
jgi:hypothetical protein